MVANLEYERCSEFIKINGTIEGYDFTYNKRKRKLFNSEAKNDLGTMEGTELSETL